MEIGRWGPDGDHLQWRIQKLRFTNWSAKDTSVAHWSKHNHSRGQSDMLRRRQKYSFNWWCPKCTEDGVTGKLRAKVPLWEKYRHLLFLPSSPLLKRVLFSLFFACERKSTVTTLESPRWNFQAVAAAGNCGCGDDFKHGSEAKKKKKEI